ncbi:MAG: hypothetical protein ACLFQK_04015 [Fibrobacterota bacterium]
MKTFQNFTENQKTKAFFGAVILFVSIISFATEFHKDFPQRTDDTVYLMVARTMLEDGEFRNAAMPEEPAFVNLPIVWPAFLGLYWLFFSPGLLLFRIFLYVLLAGGIWFSFLWIRKYTGDIAALFIACAFASYHMTVFAANSFLSEILFVPLLYAGLYFGSECRNNPFRMFSAGFCFILLARTRMVGVPFLLVFCVLLLAEKKYRAPVILMAAFLLLWFFEWSFYSEISGGEGYLDNISGRYPPLSDLFGFSAEVMRKYYHNISAFAGSMYANIIFPFFYSLFGMNVLKRAAVLLFFIAGFSGIGIFWKNHPSVRPFLSAVIISWMPVFNWWREGALFRYLMPFFPFLVLFPFFSLKLFLVKYSVGRTNFIIVLFVFLIFINQVLNISINRPQTEEFRRKREGFAAVHEYLDKTAPENSVVLSPQPWYTYLKTGINSSFFRDVSHYREEEHYSGYEKIYLITEKPPSPELSFDLRPVSLPENNSGWSLYVSD